MMNVLSSPVFMAAVSVAAALLLSAFGLSSGNSMRRYAWRTACLAMSWLIGLATIALLIMGALQGGEYVSGPIMMAIVIFLILLTITALYRKTNRQPT